MESHVEKEDRTPNKLEAEKNKEPCTIETKNDIE